MTGARSAFLWTFAQKLNCMDFPAFPDMPLDESDSPVSFHFEDVEIELPDEAALTDWLTQTAENEGKSIAELSYIFCSDEYLLQINREHLQHDYYTDVITFQYSDAAIEGDVFISTDRVAENAAAHGATFRHELCRIMVHGLLHLAGHSDKTEAERAAMTALENLYLAKIIF